LLLLILVIAVPNRETAVFLIPSWFYLEWREQRRISAVVYSAAGIAIVELWRIWIGRMLHAGHLRYDFPWRNNLMSIAVPTHWPQLLSVFGFLAIPMWLLRGYVRDVRLRALWISSIPFLAAALVVGIWRETRIFGELTALAAVTFAIQLEQFTKASSPAAADQDYFEAS
jgi:hypothetical protein